MAGSLCDAWEHPLLGRLQSRVVMSAMTRNFAGPGHTATDGMAAYYARRARHGVGLILTEGTIVDPSGDGYRDVPYIHDRAQVESWQRVTRAVHDEGARIFCQLWHCGRISHPDFLNGASPVSASARQAAGINRQNGKPFGIPRPLEGSEMPLVYGMFRSAAVNALEAGFDGVELHCGHGYLIDQFFDARVNDRTDAYGGSVENRCRFALELTREVLEACGPARVMVRISPSRFMKELHDWPDLHEMLEHLIPALERAGLRMLDISCAQADYFETSGRVVRLVRPSWPHLLVSGASLTLEQAQHELDTGLVDMVTYGRLLIANPDLIDRFKRDRPLVPYSVGMLAALE